MQPELRTDSLIPGIMSESARNRPSTSSREVDLSKGRNLHAALMGRGGYRALKSTTRRAVLAQYPGRAHSLRTARIPACLSRPRFNFLCSLFDVFYSHSWQVVPRALSWASMPRAQVHKCKPLRSCYPRRCCESWKTRVSGAQSLQSEGFPPAAAWPPEV